MKGIEQASRIPGVEVHAPMPILPADGDEQIASVVADGEGIAVGIGRVEVHAGQRKPEPVPAKAPAETTARAFLRTHMPTIDAVMLAHQATLDGDVFVCHCGWRGTETDWLNHVADQAADRIEGV